MNNTNNLQSNNSQREITYPHTTFSIARKNYTIEELLVFFSTDFIDLISQQRVFPPELPFAVIRGRMPTLSLVIIVIPSFTHSKILFCDNCPTLGQGLTPQLRPLINSETLTQVLPQTQNHHVALTVTLPNNPHSKSPHLNSIIKSTSTTDRRTSILSRYFCQVYR